MSSSSKYFQSPQLSQDLKEFLSTLPRKEVFSNGHPLCRYQYQGFWYADVILEAVISIQEHFQAEDSDVFVASNPKCGTTWLKAIAFALLNRRRHPATSGDHPFLSRNPHDLVPFLEIGFYGSRKARDIASFSSPRLLATHVPHSSLPESIRSKCKIVYVAWPFWDHVVGYWKQSLENPDRVLFLKYEDMKARPAAEVRRVAEFLGCAFSAEEEEGGEVDRIVELCSFEGLRGLEVNKKGKQEVTGMDNSAFFRRGEVGDWKNHLSPEMAKRIDRITEEKFSGSGLFL